MVKKITLEELLKLLNPQIKYLARQFAMKTIEKEDLEQEFRMKIIEDVRSGKGQKKGIGWWFLRLKWYAIYIYRREIKKPLSKSISIEAILENTEEYKAKRRSGNLIYDIIEIKVIHEE